jgi:chemotaxis protein MotB
MKRPREHEQDDGPSHERWLLSYADFITLLFAFFVVMYALSTVSQTKYQQLSSSLNHAFDAEKTRQNSLVANSGLTVLPASAGIKPDEDPFAISKIKKERQKNESKKLISALIQELNPMINQGKINVVQSERGIRIDIKDSLLFAPGEHHLEHNKQSVNVLLQILPLLINGKQPIEIEGHTDNTPIKNKDFHSNWELSARRATNVLEFFNQAGVADDRLSAIAFGASKPIASNEDENGRSENRRVSIVILRESNY